MKIQLYWLLLAALLLLSGKADAANNKKPFVIPELQEWRGAQGMFTPTATSRIVYTGKDPSVARVANQFAEDYELMFGRRMQVVQGGCRRFCVLPLVRQPVGRGRLHDEDH